MNRARFASVLAVALVLGCSQQHEEKKAAAAEKLSTPPAPSAGMSISSPAFANDGAMPARYTCNGSNVSPPLAFTNVPQQAHSLALEVTDPDAPGGLFTHWLVWNMPTTLTGLTEGAVPKGVVEGLNGFGKSSYGSPCPPSGTHRYLFDLYALDNTLALPSSAGREQFEAAIKGHIVGQARLVARYGK